MTQESFHYLGNELDIFVLAANWKQYWGGFVKPYLGSSVLEVGAGFGANTNCLHSKQDKWVCLEPDHDLAQQLAANTAQLEPAPEVIVGTIQDLAQQSRFNCILYLDVLEHIEQAQEELSAAARHLNPNGFLVLLVPALQFLYSPFDKQVGHHRRYCKQTLRKDIPLELTEKDLKYLDSVGLAASLSNKLFLRQALPTKSQILFWDSTIIPISRRFDALLLYSLGKSLLGIWQKS